MTGSGIIRWFKPLWLRAWPIWSLAVFGSLAAVYLLPGGYARAVIAGPILLMVPGSLTLGAAFGRRTRPHGVAFVCFATLLSAAWWAFASLALYALGMRITAGSTYQSLFLVSTVLAIIAETRLLLDQPGSGRRARAKPEGRDPDVSDTEVRDVSALTAAKETPYYAIMAVVAGVGLLAGGLIAYDQLSHPTPTGYTWIAWTGLPPHGDVAVGASGTELHFQIVHQQSDTARFRLTAAWLGSTAHPLAKPLTLTMGPNQTFRGALFVPPLPDGCTYRLEVALTAAHQINPLTKKPQTWSIDADVSDPHKPLRTCKT